MGYAHIENLYRESAKAILAFKECYALEKIHGTSACVTWHNKTVQLSPGGESPVNFAKLFDIEKLSKLFEERFGTDCVVKVHGEAYGGKQQKQSWRYGPNLKFVAFDVCVNDKWLEIPKAEEVVKYLGLEFVSYKKISTDLQSIDAERDAPSEQAKRNGLTDKDYPREGVVLRPIIECTDEFGERICAKHKRDDERETTTPRKVNEPSPVLEKATEVAIEYVTETRLQHVLDKIANNKEMKAIPLVIKAMIEDVKREGSGEFVDSPEVTKAIRDRTIALFKSHLHASIVPEKKPAGPCVE